MTGRNIKKEWRSTIKTRPREKKKKDKRSLKQRRKQLWKRNRKI